MPKRFYKAPAHVVKEWPEVFSDLYMNTMPVAYLNVIKLEFKNGRIWEIQVKELLAKTSISEVADKLLETIYEYKDEIQKVDFDVDVERLKHDIQNETKKFF